MITLLEPWSFQVKHNFHVCGWRTPFRGKPVLHFLHGNGFCGLTYSPMLAELVDDFDLIITDLPGHGDSDSGGRFMGWNRCADICLSVFSHFVGQISPTVPRYALGHSFGGVITTLMMGKQKKHFDKAMLLDPVIFTPSMLKVMAAGDLFGLLRYSPMAKQALGRQDTWDNREAAFNAFQGKGIFKCWTDEALQAHVDHGLADAQQGVTLKCTVKREADIFSSYPKRLWSSLSKIKTPTKILAGSDSFPFIARSLERLEGRGGFDIETLQGGHCFMQEDPKLAAEKIKQWFLI